MSERYCITSDNSRASIHMHMREGVLHKAALERAYLGCDPPPLVARHHRSILRLYTPWTGARTKRTLYTHELAPKRTQIVRPSMTHARARHRTISIRPLSHRARHCLCLRTWFKYSTPMLPSMRTRYRARLTLSASSSRSVATSP